MSGFLDALRGVLGDGFGADVQREGVRPDYGLSTVTGIGQQQKSPYERTLRPGEKRSSSDLQEMLADVVMAGAPVSGVTGRAAPTVAAASRRLPPRPPPSLSSSRNIAKFYGNRADIERSLAQLANNTEGYPQQVLERLRQKLTLALERSSK